MRAGMLDSTLVFKELTKTKSATGFITKEYVPVYTCKGSKRRLSALGDGITANEEFIQKTLIFQVRWNPKINELQRVTYNGYDYSIFLLDPQHRRDTYLITLKRIDE